MMPTPLEVFVALATAGMLGLLGLLFAVYFTDWSDTALNIIGTALDWVAERWEEWRDA